jgi:outer membrane immunogenic protein
MKSLLAAAAAIAFAVPAAAQDASTDGQPADYFNGFYVGGTFGLDATANDTQEGLVFDTDRDGSFDDNVNTTTGANAFSPGFCGGTANGNTFAQGCADDDDSYGYSIRAGIDRRLGGDGPLVAGLLVEATKSESRDFVSGFSTTPASYTIARGLDHSFAARGRLGYSPGSGRGLFYVTGGVAYGKMEHAFATTNTANSFTQVNDSKYELGGQIGGGAELYIMPNLSLSFEYLYQAFEDDDYYVEVGQGSAPATNPFLLASGGTNLRPANTDFNIHSFRVGANFRF